MHLFTCSKHTTIENLNVLIIKIQNNILEYSNITELKEEFVCEILQTTSKYIILDISLIEKIDSLGLSFLLFIRSTSLKDKLYLLVNNDTLPIFVLSKLVESMRVFLTIDEINKDILKREHKEK